MLVLVGIVAMIISTQPAFIDALTAVPSNKDISAELNPFSQFIGTWHLEVTYLPEGGAELKEEGEWHFAPVLNGNAIQDIWIVPRRDRIAAGESIVEYGTTLRYYDPSISAWRSTWIGPVRNRLLPFIARQEGPEIVLSREETDGELVRWIFFEITQSSFRWRAESSTDSGKTWRKEQEMHVWRIDP